MAQDLLKKIYLFQDLNDQELSYVNQVTQLKTYNPGDEIFSQGDPATALYVIRMGSVKIIKKGKQDTDINITTMGSGAHFGEMSMLDHETRSATAEVLEKSEILQMDYAQLNKVFEAHPQIALKIYRALSIFLCGRLRLTTNDLSFAREKNLRHF